MARYSIIQHIHGILRRLVRQTLLVTPLSLITGTMVAFFLWLLDAVTQLRWGQPWLIYLLPVAGIAIHFLYRLWGKDAERGNNLIIDEIHEPGGGVPARMAPLVILTTLMTHLFGGSAGREGTAVQVGGSIAGFLGRKLKLDDKERRVLLMSGIAAGFGAVFGTPFAGALFAIEVLVIGRIQYEALWSCLVASFMSDLICSAWGIHHTHYAISFLPAAVSSYRWMNGWLVIKIALAGIAFGLAGRSFTGLTHQIKSFANRIIPAAWLIPFAGGCIIVLLTFLTGTTDYLGLGVIAQPPNGISIVNAFKAGGVPSFSWGWKLLFTAITIGTGFKGGEVTPLFFIGAALGNALAGWLGLPVDLLAGLGFIAVFAGAAKTRIACAIMGAELFGLHYLPYYAVACLMAYFFSGKQGIYSAQRTRVSARV